MGQGFKVAARARLVAAGALLCAALESPAIDAELNGAAPPHALATAESLSSEQRADDSGCGEPVSARRMAE